MQNKKATDSKSDALFIGWQENPQGGVFPLYIVTAVNHPYYGSSVSEKTLTKLNLKFSKQPTFIGKDNTTEMSGRMLTKSIICNRFSLQTRSNQAT